MHVLLITGSTRPGSTNTLALRKLHESAHPDVVTDLYMELPDLPGFVPGQDPPPAVQDMLSRVETADAVIFSTPEYAGGLPGTLKNLLDWTVGGGQLYGKPVAWLDIANPGRGHGAREQLRIVLGYVGAHIVEKACVHVAVDGGDDRPFPPSEQGQLIAALADAVAARTS